MSAIEIFNKLNYVLCERDEKGFYYYFLDSKEFYIYFDEKNKQIIFNDNYDNVIDMPILRAINQQVKELWWLDER